MTSGRQPILFACPFISQGYDVLFYGDSIFETLRGTDKCRPCDKMRTRSSCAGVPAIFQRFFGRYRPGVMALAMDQTANLLWRLQNGAIPKKHQVCCRAVMINNAGFRLVARRRKVRTCPCNQQRQPAPDTLGCLFKGAVAVLQAKVSVLLIGTNDLTNCAWGATIQSVKELALAREEPGIVSRCEHSWALPDLT